MFTKLNVCVKKRESQIRVYSAFVVVLPVGLGGHLSLPISGQDCSQMFNLVCRFNTVICIIAHMSLELSPLGGIFPR